MSTNTNEINKEEPSKENVVIGVTSARGGSGKSSISSLLGQALAKGEVHGSPKSVCVVDFDVLDIHLGYILGSSNISNKRTLHSDYVDAGGSVSNTEENVFGELFEKVIRDNIIYSEKFGFHAIVTPLSSMPEGTENGFYRAIIDKLRNMFDVVILDTAPVSKNGLGYEIVLDAVFDLSDNIFFVSKLDEKSMSETSHWLLESAKPVSQGGHGLDLGKTGVVGNRYKRGISVSRDEAIEAAQGTPILAAFPEIPKETMASELSNLLEENAEYKSSMDSLARRFFAKKHLFS